MKDLRIQISGLAREVAADPAKYVRQSTNSESNRLSNHNGFTVVGTVVSEYDGMEVTSCVSAHKTWTSAVKVLKEKAQELTFDERAKAFDFMKANRDEGAAIQAVLQKAIADARDAIKLL